MSTPIRHIVVRCCVQCPCCERATYKDNPPYSCRAVRTNEPIEDPKTIPDWCPLAPLPGTSEVA